MRRRDLLTLIALTFLAPAAVQGAEEKKKSGENKKKSGGEDYIPINPVNGTTNKAGGRRGVLSVDCGLQISDPKLREFAEKSLPRLRAAYVQVVQVYAAGLPSGSEPDAQFLAQSLQRQTDLVLKRPGARLLIGAVIAS